MKNSRKKGLFLSIETVGVIIIITAIAAVVVAGIAHLFKMYKVYQISRDISQYSEAVTQFKISFKYLPGDVPSSKLNAALNNSILVADASNAYYSPKLPQGFISQQSGSALAWRELYLAKLISYNVNTTSASGVDAASGCGAMNSLVKTNQIVPLASWDESLAWHLVSVIDSTTNGVIKNADISANWGSSRPRLILFRYSKLTATTDCGVDIAIASKDLAAISPAIAFDLDSKLDDGKPSDVTSRLIGENYVPNTCTDLGATPTTVMAAKYLSSTDDGGTKGCIITYGIDTDA